MLAAAGILVQEIFYLRVLTSVFLGIALAESWNLLGGYTGYINFGYVGFFGIGMLTAALAGPRGLGLWPLAAGGAAAAGFGLVGGSPTSRLRGPYFAWTTVALGLMGEMLAGNLDRLTGGGLGIVMPRPLSSRLVVEREFYAAFGLVAALAVLTAFVIEHGPWGYALRAIREDEDAARSIGIRATRYKLAMLCGSAFFAGILGGLYGYYVGYISPEGAFNLLISIKAIVYSVVGGMGTWAGPVIGAAVMELLATYLTLLSPSLQEISQVLFGVILIIVVLLAPRGITGWVRGYAGWGRSPRRRPAPAERA